MSQRSVENEYFVPSSMPIDNLMDFEQTEDPLATTQEDVFDFVLTADARGPPPPPPMDYVDALDFLFTDNIHTLLDTEQDAYIEKSDSSKFEFEPSSPPPDADEYIENFSMEVFGPEPPGLPTRGDTNEYASCDCDVFLTPEIYKTIEQEIFVKWAVTNALDNYATKEYSKAHGIAITRHGYNFHLRRKYVSVINRPRPYARLINSSIRYFEFPYPQNQEFVDCVFDETVPSQKLLRELHFCKFFVDNVISPHNWRGSLPVHTHRIFTFAQNLLAANAWVYEPLNFGAGAEFFAMNTIIIPWDEFGPYPEVQPDLPAYLALAVSIMEMGARIVACLALSTDDALEEAMWRNALRANVFVAGWILRQKERYTVMKTEDHEGVAYFMRMMKHARRTPYNNDAFLSFVSSEELQAAWAPYVYMVDCYRYRGISL